MNTKLPALIYCCAGYFISRLISHILLRLLFELDNKGDAYKCENRLVLNYFADEGYDMLLAGRTVLLVFPLAGRGQVERGGGTVSLTSTENTTYFV